MRKGEPSVFVVNATIITSFPAKPDDFRDKHLLTHPIASVREIHYRGGRQRPRAQERREGGVVDDSAVR